MNGQIKKVVVIFSEKVAFQNQKVRSKQTSSAREGKMPRLLKNSLLRAVVSCRRHHKWTQWWIKMGMDKNGTGWLQEEKWGMVLRSWSNSAPISAPCPFSLLPELLMVYQEVGWRVLIPKRPGTWGVCALSVPRLGAFSRQGEIWLCPFTLKEMKF